MTLGATGTYSVCGVEIAGMSPGTAASAIIRAAIDRRRLEVHLCNAYTLSMVDSDEQLRSALTKGDLNLPDGAPVAWLGRRRGTRGPVRGPSLVANVVDQGRAFGLRHYFFGAGPGVADLMARRLEARYPGMLTAGTESPPYARMDESEVRRAAERVHAAGTSVLWIGLGTPRQDHLVPRIARHLDMPVIPVGAAFDYWSGRLREAPPWLHGTGLEWSHRLASEPRRLFRRYVVGNPRFILRVARHWEAPR